MSDSRAKNILIRLQQVRSPAHHTQQRNDHHPPDSILKEVDMKRTLLVSIITALLLLTGLVQAQALFETANAAGTVTFFNGNPRFEAVELATVRINNSPLAMTMTGLEQATHATINIEGALYTFVLAENGLNKNTIMLTVPANSNDIVQLGDGGRTSLAELFDRLATDPTLLTRLGSSTLTGQ